MTGFTHNFNPTILREYDIRGLVGKTLNVADVYAVGRAFGTMVKRRGGSKVGLCYDGRYSSVEFSEAMTKGLNDSGIDVENYGLNTTPVMYYAVYHLRDIDGGIAITGSHNPSDYNGIKIMLRGGESVNGQAIRDLGAMAAKGDIDSGTGTSTNVDIDDAYIDRLVADYKSFNQKPLKIVWDAGNGVAGKLLPKFTSRLPGEHILLYADVDGDFPNHHPDPMVAKNLEDLKKAVLDHKADLGIAFDGDGDRIGAVDHNGESTLADQLITLYARAVLSEKPGGKITFDVFCSKVTTDFVEKNGGEAVLTRTGCALIRPELKKMGALMGGELSGHIIFNDGFYGYDDGMYCAVRLLNVINQFGDLASQKKLFPQIFATPQMRFEVPDEEKFDMVDRAKQFVQQNLESSARIVDIDGVRLITPDGWWILRASNKQNALTARVEGTTQAACDTLFAGLQKALKAANIPTPDDLINSASHH